MGSNISRQHHEGPHKRLRIASKHQPRLRHARQQLCAFSFRSSKVHAESSCSRHSSSSSAGSGIFSSFRWGGRTTDTDAQEPIQPAAADAAVQVESWELTAGPAAMPGPPDKWKKGECIGTGAFGHVYLGLNCSTGELLAVKEVTMCIRDSLHQQEAWQQLEQELSVLSSLSHPNIVRCYGTAREGPSLLIFLEYVPGGSLASLIAKFGPLDEAVIRTYTRQLLSGLAYLHALRTIHRDIKCANLLLDKEGVIKLADLGMAKQLVEAVSVTQSFKGSAFWMAPEVVRQQGHGPAADIWSVGCTVLEMATGKPPWHECTSQVQAIYKIASSNESPAAPETLSPMAASFLQLCLHRDPAMRPSAQQLLQHPFVSGADVHIPPCPLLQQQRQQQQREQQQQQQQPYTTGDSLDEVSLDAAAAAYTKQSSRGTASRWDQQQQMAQGQRNVSPKRTRTTSATAAGRAAGRGSQAAGVNRQQSSNGWKPAGAAAIAAAAAAPGSFRQLQSRLVGCESSAAGGAACSVSSVQIAGPM